MTDKILKEQIEEKYILKNCKIKPLGDYMGVITSVCINKGGFEFQVRYYMNSEQKTNWFYDYEIEVQK